MLMKLKLQASHPRALGSNSIKKTQDDDNNLDMVPQEHHQSLKAS